ACGGCSRMNPPNRLTCIYCGGQLEIRIEDASFIKTHRRKLEPGERGFNLILREMDTGIKLDVEKIAGLLSMDAVDLATILDAATPLPLVRLETWNEAAMLRAGLEDLGV